MNDDFRVQSTPLSLEGVDDGLDPVRSSCWAMRFPRALGRGRNIHYKLTRPLPRDGAVASEWPGPWPWELRTTVRPSRHRVPSLDASDPRSLST